MSQKTEVPYRIPRIKENSLPWQVEQNLETLRDAFDAYVNAQAPATTPKAQASGQATITSGLTSVIVTHNLGITGGAYGVVATLDATNQAVGGAWISSRAANTFTISVVNAAPAGGWHFNWILLES